MRKMNKERILGFLLGMTAVAAVGIVAGWVWAGDLEPKAAPGPTFKTLDEIPGSWSRILPADDGDPDGCNSSRFDCVMGGDAVLDKETGLVWERNPRRRVSSWDAALGQCIARTYAGGRTGWRLPLVHELSTLQGSARGGGVGLDQLPLGHPFTTVEAADYWSATTPGIDASRAWVNHFGSPTGAGGRILTRRKSDRLHYWCVRGATSISY